MGKFISIVDENGNDISSNKNHIGNINPFRYRSYYYDIETNLYYLNSRYYNPIWGRFLNVDRIVGANQDILSYNLYAYCSNNSITNSDRDGMWLFNVVRNIIFNVANGIKKIFDSILTISDISEKNTENITNLPDYTNELNAALIRNTSQALMVKDLFSGPSAINYFYEQVKAHGPWDYKLEEKWSADMNVPYLGLNGKFLYNGEVTTAEQFGNIHYGFVGTAMGFQPEMLYIGGGYAAQGGFTIRVFIDPYYGDSYNDHVSIKRGINMYYGKK